MNPRQVSAVHEGFRYGERGVQEHSERVEGMLDKLGLAKTRWATKRSRTLRLQENRQHPQ